MKKPTKPTKEEPITETVFQGKKIPGSYLLLRNGVVHHIAKQHEVICWGPNSTDAQREELAKLLISLNTHALINYTLQENETLCNVIKTLPMLKDDEWIITTVELVGLYKIHLRDQSDQNDQNSFKCIHCGTYDDFFVMSYRVVDAMTPITFVKDFNDTTKIVDYEFNRIDGNVTEIKCRCAACGNEFEYTP